MATISLVILERNTGMASTARALASNKVTRRKWCFFTSMRIRLENFFSFGWPPLFKISRDILFSDSRPMVSPDIKPVQKNSRQTASEQSFDTSTNPCLALALALILAPNPCLALALALKLAPNPCLALALALILAPNPCLALALALILAPNPCLALALVLILAPNPCLALALALILAPNPLALTLAPTLAWPWL